MTPMKRLKDQFKVLRDNLAYIFSELTLNKSDPKHSRYGGEYGYGGYTKGVENDFLRIFVPGRGGNANPTLGTFAFVIDYIYKDEPTFFVQIKRSKENDSIISSPSMDFETFRKKLNELNKKVVDGNKSLHKNLTSSEVFMFVDDIFIHSGKSLDAEIKEAEKIVKGALKASDKEIQEAQSDLDSCKAALKAAENRVKNSVARCKETKKIAEIEAQLAELKHAQTEKRKDYEAREEIPAHKRAVRSSTDILGQAKYKREKQVIDLRKRFPAMVFNRINKDVLEVV